MSPGAAHRHVEGICHRCSALTAAELRLAATGTLQCLTTEAAMCTIDKMLIKGIRSFSPHNQGVIEFYRPLTLIVGHNGAGKTV